MTTNYVGIIESKLRQTNEKPVLLARSLVTSQNLTVPLRVANFSSEDVTIYKNTTLGIFSTIDEDFDKDKGVCGAVNSSTVCTGIRNTIDNMHVDCSLNLEQKGRLNSLLEEYSSIFSKGPADLGRTSLVKHHIETGSSCPLRQGKHIEGKKRHRNADGMSRIPCHQCGNDENINSAVNRQFCYVQNDTSRRQQELVIKNDTSAGSGTACCSSRITDTSSTLREQSSSNDSFQKV
ncbi:unnamed protein product [Mytilus edulis]|uniref:Uncharacterized protein n=1 Tax=Mytilus edulis TaxID=6550 RepID=A0A8S3Q1D5_MYTED|nr:unnamed protein product [Mytilus edulis]